MRRAALIVSILAASGCGRCSERAPDPVSDPACASACAALVTAGCPAPGLSPSDAADCTRTCETKAAELAAARCDAERRTYLGCVSTARIDCAAAQCGAAVCIEHRTGIAGCEREHAAYTACIAPCLHAGAEHLTESAQTTRLGCAACSELAKGAPAGSPCQSPKVCSEQCCTCPDGRVRFRARVCDQGRCAGEQVCRLARSAGQDPCVAQER